MRYEQVEAGNVLTTISAGYNVTVCDITDKEIKNTNDLTVADIRNYTSKENVVFLVVKDE